MKDGFLCDRDSVDRQKITLRINSSRENNLKVKKEHEKG